MREAYSVGAKATGVRQTRRGYRLSLVATLAFLALALLAIVDFRRGFLFTGATDFGRYVLSTPYFRFSPWHLLMLGIGLAGLVSSLRRLQRCEAELREENLEGVSRWLAAGLFGLLVVDLFTYRGAPAVRAALGGTLGAAWLEAFGVSGWLRPVALSASYLLTVWHASFLGVLFAGLALTVLPRYLKSFFSQRGFRGNLFGAAFALPQPFCSCCASIIAPSFVRQGASTNFSLAFVVGSPMLNLTGLILALLLLPTPYAIIRVLAGIVLAIPVTYGVTRLAERWGLDDEASPQSRAGRWMSRWVGRYCRVFHLDELLRERPLDTPGQFLPAWFSMSGRIALLLIPTLLVWSIAAAAIVQALPAAFGNNLPSVVISAIAGTLLMISTWTEIPVAQQLIQANLFGPAATLLVVLPPVSLPCLLLLAGALGRFRVVGLLSLAVALAGIAAGVLFL